MLDVAAKQDF